MRSLVQDEGAPSARRRVETWRDAAELLQLPTLRQALYDGSHLMDGSLVTLHGDEHRMRRELESPVFTLAAVTAFENDVFPTTIPMVLGPQVAQGEADLAAIGIEWMLTTAAAAAGIDVDGMDDIRRLADHIRRFAEALVIAHTTRDPDDVRREAAEALDAFDRDFLTPSIERRTALLADVDNPTDPRTNVDVLTAVLARGDGIGLDRDTVLHEIAVYVMAGSNSSTSTLLRSLHLTFEWLREHPEDREALVADKGLVQRFVLESLRLHPPTPDMVRQATETVTTRSGLTIEAGEIVHIDAEAVNHDTSVFGPDADRFNPYRPASVQARPVGLSFGLGMHQCMGQRVAGGILASAENRRGRPYGLVPAMMHALLVEDVRPHPTRPPVPTTTHTRPLHWSSYPVALGPDQISDQTSDHAPTVGAS
ncbi:cytochrome P450 [Nocardioides hwasunensis]|uniref:Cytochrome P450 n=1 Tax=Nocardioides hwasunensis TaxID=397258 RepID=A0ABR8MKL9_9ACTN|nr:cytochrome P450 [Nocardioides hwasunensis]MBD3915059.1 cytochrome P450 [Nocardioides hwasunensis]